MKSGDQLNYRNGGLTKNNLIELCARGDIEEGIISPKKSFARKFLYKNYLKLGCQNGSFSEEEYFYHSEGFLVFVILMCAYLCRFFSASWTLPLVAAVFILSRGRISSLPSTVSDTVLMMVICSLWATSLAFWFRTGNRNSFIWHMFVSVVAVLVEPRLWGLSLGLLTFMLLADFMTKRGIVFVKAENLQETSLDEKKLGISGLWQLLGLPLFEDQPHSEKNCTTKETLFIGLK